METKKNGSWQILFFVAFISSVVSLNFLDPINWPKQIALLTLIPLIYYYSTRDLNLSQVKQSLSRPLLPIILVSLISLGSALARSPNSFTRDLWGLWGRANGFLTTASLIVLTSAVVIANSRFQMERKTVQFISIFMGMIAIYGLFQEFGLDPFEWSKSGEVFGLFGNTNFASAIWAIGAISSVAALIIEPEVRIKAFFGFMLSLNATACWLTNSIQGLFTTSIGVTAILIVRYFQPLKQRLSVILLGVPLLLLVVLGTFGRGPLGEYFYQYTMKLRSFYWLTGIRIGNSNPISGVGIDSYGDAFRKTRTTEMAQATSIDLIANNAHNAFIQIYATMGIIGLISIFPLFALGVYVSTRYLLMANFKDSAYEVTTRILFLCLFLISLVSIDNISVAVWLYFFLGIALSSNSKFPHENKEAKKKSNLYDFHRIVSGILAVLLFSYSWIISNPDREILRILRTPAFQDDPASLDSREQSLFDVLRNGNLMEGQFGIIAQAFVGMKRYGSAIFALDVATKKYPNDFPLLAQKAILEFEYGDLDESIVDRKKMVELDPRHAVSYLALALSYERKDEVNVVNKYLELAKLNSSFLSQEQIDELSKIEVRLLSGNSNNP